MQRTHRLVVSHGGLGAGLTLLLAMAGCSGGSLEPVTTSSEGPANADQSALPASAREEEATPAASAPMPGDVEDSSIAESPGAVPVLPGPDSPATDSPPTGATAATEGAADNPADSAAEEAPPTTPTPTRPIDATGGSGGPVGPTDLVSGTGLSFKINAPEGNDARGLLILLHGSTASNYTTFVRMMADVAAAYDLIPVSVLAPNGQGWNEGNQRTAAEQLHRLIQEDLYPRYNIDKSRVVFSGQSSGGGFLSSNFVPAHAKDYKGGAFFQCGAAPPNVAFAPDEQTRANFRVHFEITTGDPIWPESYAQSLAAYSQVQVALTMDNTKPGGHCAFDQQQVIFDHIDFILGG